jgi:hypothetical protein
MVWRLASALLQCVAVTAVTTPNQGSLRVVFSSGCNAYQHWQSEVSRALIPIHFSLVRFLTEAFTDQVLKASAWRSGMKAPITHIVVGCNQQQRAGEGQDAHTSGGGDADRLVEEGRWRKSAHPNVDLYFAPATEMARKFPWFNKPWSFFHWADKMGSTIKEDIIAILDPDEFFMSPLVLNAPPEQLLKRITWTHLQDLGQDPHVPDFVRPGVAVAQRYGLGSFWTREKDDGGVFDRPSICGKNSAVSFASLHVVGARMLVCNVCVQSE